MCRETTRLCDWRHCPIVSCTIFSPCICRRRDEKPETGHPVGDRPIAVFGHRRVLQRRVRVNTDVAVLRSSTYYFESLVFRN